MKANISYKQLQRIEKYPIPETALREAILNAIVHKDYTSGSPVQISVYNNKIIIWNAGELPDKWTVEHLKKKHPSIPFNPDIANAFFRAGMIEAWGRGTVKIISDCKKANAHIPNFTYDLSGFVVEFPYESMKASTIKISKSLGTSEKIIALILHNEKITIPELSKQLTVSLATIKRILQQLQLENKIERVGSNKNGIWKVVSL
jgi:ATP-dependent DNA helicase RecG